MPRADPTLLVEWQERSLDFDRIIETLNDEAVEYLIIGSLAAVVHGGPLPSFEIEIVPQLSPENIERLKLALSGLGAKGCEDLRDRLEKHDIVSCMTDDCLLAINPWPSGSHGFEDIRFDARKLEVYEALFARVASLDDVVRMMSASSDVDVMAAIPALRYLQDLQSPVA